MRRLAGLLLALAVVLGAIPSAQPAVADDKGWIGSAVEWGCDFSAVGALDLGFGTNYCNRAGSAVDKKVKEEWASVWNSTVGDWLKAGVEMCKVILRKTLTLALSGPSLRLEDTGLWGGEATLAGMMTWLGLLISVLGFMWQAARMAVAGQAKHLWRAASGWGQNAVLCFFGVSLVALLLATGDALTDGLVRAVFDDDKTAYDQILSVMIPEGILNPAIVVGGIIVLVVVGFIQLMLVFLRQSAIPIQCLLIPIAGAGRVGGDATQKWVPKLISSILVCIAYKPILAVIICVGFTELGKADGTSAWLRGLATLLLGILAPGPLTRIFASLSEELGSGMSSAGAMGAAGAIGAMASRGRGNDAGDGAGGGGGGGKPRTAVEHANHVEQSMSRSSDQSDGDSKNADAGDALDQAARTGAGQIPRQAPAAEGTGVGGPVAGAGVGATAAVTGVGAAVQVLDGLNGAVQRGAGEIGSGGGL